MLTLLPLFSSLGPRFRSSSEVKNFESSLSLLMFHPPKLAINAPPDSPLWRFHPSSSNNNNNKKNTKKSESS